VITEFTSCPELLRSRAQQFGDETYLVSAQLELSYAEFDARTDRVAGGLAGLGVNAGDVVSIFMPNRVEYLEAWWATWKLGAVFNPVNASFRESEAAFVVGHAGARIAIADAEGSAALASCRSDLPGLAAIVDVDGTSGDVAFADLQRGDASAIADVEVRADDLAALVYTSGTTGRPKGAMLTHANYLADAAMIAEIFPAGAGDRFGMILPLFHVNAQVVSTLAPMFVGGTIAMWDRFSASTFWKTVETLRPITFSAVPTILATLLRAPGAGEADTGSLQFVLCGAAPMTVELCDEFESRFGLRIMEGYGLTEGTCASTVNPYYGTRRIGSVGLPLRGQQVAIVGSEGVPLKPHEPGEVVVRGPNVMSGYFRDESATADALNAGWLRTGDVGYLDEDGFLFLVDRLKDMIIRGGENVYPREVEAVLSLHPAVVEAAVVGLPDDVRGQEIHAVVVLGADHDVTMEQLEDFVAERLARYKLPRTYEVRDELPRNPTGKVVKRTLVDDRLALS
jgi:long-chain acyl-CoA synthetase